MGMCEREGRGDDASPPAQIGARGSRAVPPHLGPMESPFATELALGRHRVLRTHGETAERPVAALIADAISDAVGRAPFPRGVALGGALVGVSLGIDNEHR